MLEIVQDSARLALDSAIRSRRAISMSIIISSDQYPMRDSQRNLGLKIAGVFVDQGTEVPGIDTFINDGIEWKELPERQPNRKLSLLPLTSFAR